MIGALRDLGLEMGSWYAPYESDERDALGELTGEKITTRTFVGWTCDKAKADAAQELGATLRPYTSTDARFAGWEVSCRVVES